MFTPTPVQKIVLALIQRADDQGLSGTFDLSVVSTIFALTNGPLYRLYGAKYSQAEIQAGLNDLVANNIVGYTGVNGCLRLNLGGVMALKVDKNGVLVGTQSELNLIEGAGVTLTVVNNPLGRVDVTIASGSVVLLSTDNTWTASNRFKGPIPYWDVTAYGATSHGSNQGPTTGTMTSGSPNITLASALDFANGQGIAVIGAGAVATVAAPDFSTKAIASSSGLVRVAQVVTVTTAIPHGISMVGSGIFITIAGADNTTFNGVWWVTAVTSTTLTYGQFPALGDATSQNGTLFVGASHFGGTVAGATTYNYKIVSVDIDGGYSAASLQISATLAAATLSELEYVWLWWLPPTGTDYSCVYRNGTFIGRAYGQGWAGFKDIGGAGVNKTANVPSAAPAIAGNKTLVSMIVSGGGTPSLVLADNAGVNVIAVNVYHDESAFINSALVAASNFEANGMRTSYVLVPAGLYWATRIKWQFGLRMKLIGNIRPITHPVILDGAGTPWIEGDGGNASAIAYGVITSGIIFGSDSPEGIVTRGSGQTIRNLALSPLNTHGIVCTGTQFGGPNGLTFDNLNISTSGVGKGMIFDGDTIFVRMNAVHIQTDPAVGGPAPIAFSATGIPGSYVDLFFDRCYFNFHGIRVESPARTRLQQGQPATFQHVRVTNMSTETQKDLGFFIVDASAPTAYGSGVTLPDNSLIGIDFSDNVTPFKGVYYFPRGAVSSPNLIMLGVPVSGPPIGVPNVYDQIAAYPVFISTMSGGRLDEQWPGTGQYHRFTSQAYSTGVPVNISYSGDGGTDFNSFGIAVPRPRQDPLIDAGVGGSISAGTYFYIVSALDAAGGETVPSNEQSFTTLASHIVQVGYSTGGAFVKYAPKYRIYRSTVSQTYTSVNYYETTHPFTFNDSGQAPTGTGTPQTFTNAWMSRIAVMTGKNSWLLASDATMKLGIGTTAPTKKLSVIGGVTADTINGTFYVDGIQYTTIQSAVDAASAAGGGNVVLPAAGGSWTTFSTAVTVPASVGIIGPGRQNLTLNYSGTGAAFVIHPTPAPFYAGATISGFTLQGPAGGSPVVVGTIALDMQDTDLYRVYDIEFTRIETGVRLYANTSNYCEANHFHDLYFSTVRYPFAFNSATSANKDFDHNLFENMWVNLIGSAGNAGVCFFFSSNLVCTAQNFIARNIVLFPTDTTQVFLRCANAAHQIDKAVFEIKRAVAVGYTTYRPFTLEVSGSFVNYDGFLADAGANALSGGTTVGLGATTWQLNQVGVGTTAPKAQFHSAVSTIIGAASAANADADIGNNQVNVWIDEVGAKLTFRVRQSGGTYKTGTVALA